MSDELNQNIDIIIDNNVTIIQLRRSIDNFIFQLISDLLSSVPSPAPKKVLLNLKNIKVITSADLGRLLLLSKILDNDHNHTHLALCNVSPQIMDALKITGLIKKFKIVPEAGDADGGDSCGVSSRLIPPQPSNRAKVSLWPPLSEED